ncbi:MAG: class I SAM-dependent methyltransferase [Caulobacteraceae bacterium]|nr:class I SAM-dependent methyltransferase [Caulobacteraceae bacterium]
MNEGGKLEALRALLKPFPASLAVVEAIVEGWPEHAAYLLKSFEARSPEVLRASETVALAVVRLMDGGAPRFAADYRWLCDRLREEELFFHREGRYRLSTFQQALNEVYRNAPYMERYVNGMLLSHLAWYNHAATFEMFQSALIAASARPFDYLEVGPGHGLMIYFAAQSALARSLEAWDVSAVSLRETRAALDRLALEKPLRLREMDILGGTGEGERDAASAFDLVVISEVLEHLERPADALRFLRGALRDDGRLFVNVPLNSPSPDHIYLLREPDEARALIEAGGFKVEEIRLFATQNMRLDRALANKVSVSAAIIAVPA